MAEIEKLYLKSMDIVEEKREQLKALFPEAFTEGQKIDFERLRLTLGEMVDPGKERYGMNWPGKADCFKIIQQPSIAALTPAREESVDFDTTGNLFIEGDNLEVLKLLQKSYFGKVKMIYIDPPYNTGNDFIYPDDYSESLDTYLRYTGQIDNEGRKYSTNTEADGRFHSKWMNMMYPRLFLAMNLLRDNGVIFVSIDYNEEPRLRLMMDEVFGEENYRNTFAVARVKKNIQEKEFVKRINWGYNSILFYAKSDDAVLIPPTRKQSKKERWHSFDAPGIRSTMEYELFDQKPPVGRHWMYEEKRAREMINKGELRKNHNTGKPEYKLPASEDTLLDTNWTDIQESDSEWISNGGKNPHLIKRLINMMDKESIILDFFSGSCTTAHAVLELNNDDGGNRKFIMVQLPETIEENSEAYKAGYKTIADIGKERIRRVIKKIKGEQEKKKDLFSGDKPQPDLGFKVFKLQPSNFKLWDGDVAKDEEAIKKQIKLFVEHINPQSCQEDILYEILLKSGFPLTTKIEKTVLAEKDVFSIADGSMLICLEKDLTPEVIKEMAEMKPVRVVCLDEGFKGNDQLKTNAVQIMKTRNITFRTV